MKSANPAINFSIGHPELIARRNGATGVQAHGCLVAITLLSQFGGGRTPTGLYKRFASALAMEGGDEQASVRLA